MINHSGKTRYQRSPLKTGAKGLNGGEGIAVPKRAINAVPSPVAGVSTWMVDEAREIFATKTGCKFDPANISTYNEKIWFECVEEVKKLHPVKIPN